MQWHTRICILTLGWARPGVTLENPWENWDGDMLQNNMQPHTPHVAEDMSGKIGLELQPLKTSQIDVHSF